MKVERWEEETDEEWAERLTEEIAIANNTEISEYFVERDSYAEDAIIINYIGEGSWTWKEHPEGPFKADQIIGWKIVYEEVVRVQKELQEERDSYTPSQVAMSGPGAFSDLELLDEILAVREEQRE